MIYRHRSLEEDLELHFKVSNAVSQRVQAIMTLSHPVGAAVAAHSIRDGVFQVNMLLRVRGVPWFIVERFAPHNHRTTGNVSIWTMRCYSTKTGSLVGNSVPIRIGVVNKHIIAVMNIRTYTLCYNIFL